ncbi:MAG TPA: twin-arginine translocase subunit TatB [Rhodospirillaceae bacterium]|nr:twin-arginine translocase subunit TatB [Rhodospirillaceae bacterium]|tara:strand:+ start:3565 stop:4002 length:438 start_codon:yes stop_codon:yes gene_type:complete
MFDIGGWEFLLIAILGIIIIGPKELPGAIRAVSMFVRRAREMAQEFQSGLEEVAQEAELNKLAETVKTAVDPMERVRREIKDSVDPDGNIKDAINFDNELTNDDLVYYDDPELTKDNEIAPSDPEHSPREEENPETELDKPEKSV